jgi:hypothetical protein
MCDPPVDERKTTVFHLAGKSDRRLVERQIDARKNARCIEAIRIKGVADMSQPE